MELSFLLQDGHVNKLRFRSEVLCQEKKKKRAAKKSGPEFMTAYVLTGTKSYFKIHFLPKNVIVKKLLPI